MTEQNNRELLLLLSSCGTNDIALALSKCQQKMAWPIDINIVGCRKLPHDKVQKKCVHAFNIAPNG